MSGPWIMLRGLVRDSRHWGALPERLAANSGVEVLTPDHAGVGTEFERVAPVTIDGMIDDLRSRLPLERPVRMFGVSLGGMVALRWAERFPNELRHVVVVNTTANDVASTFQRFSTEAVRTMVRAVFTTDHVARERLMLALISNTDEGRAKAEHYAALARERRPSASLLARQLRAGAGAKAPAKLEVPLTILASEGDRLADPEASRRLAKRFGAPLVIHPTAGHDLPLDDPDWILERLALIH